MLPALCCFICFTCCHLFHNGTFYELIIPSGSLVWVLPWSRTHLLIACSIWQKYVTYLKHVKKIINWLLQQEVRGQKQTCLAQFCVMSHLRLIIARLSHQILRPCSCLFPACFFFFARVWMCVCVWVSVCLLCVWWRLFGEVLSKGKTTNPPHTHTQMHDTDL